MASPHSTAVAAMQPSIESLSAFTAEICARLPAELRDEIYSYLCDSSSFPAWNSKSPPAFMDHRIVGREFALEVVGWYLTNCTTLTVYSADHLPEFFNRNVYDLGVKVRDYQIKKLTIRNDIAEYERTHDDSPDSFDREAMKNFHDLISGDFRKDFTLDIKLWISMEDIVGRSELYGFGCAMKPVAEALDRNGISFTMTYTRGALRDFNVKGMIGASEYEWERFFNDPIKFEGSWFLVSWLLGRE